uniref:Uncharacterized protein n=1 Tax=Pyrodinium bahamense TaxID=73915 RepID=A0A7S0FM19_9DINO
MAVDRFCPALEPERSPRAGFPLEGLPGVTFVPALCGDLGPAAGALVEAFGQELRALPPEELRSAVALRAEHAVEKMGESNAEIRKLDPELEDEFLRQTVASNETFMAEYTRGISELRGSLRMDASVEGPAGAGPAGAGLEGATAAELQEAAGEGYSGTPGKRAATGGEAEAGAGGQEEPGLYL